MITTAQEYQSLLHRIQSENTPSLAILLPRDEKTYHIDLNARLIDSPEYLSVEKDHKAETVYFTVNRFYDFYDLTQAVCVVQYINALGESRYYVVPYYDIDTYNKKDLLLFPWVIDGDATKGAGNIQYSVRFYKLTDSGKRFLYNISTLPATSKILNGINVDDEVLDVEEDFSATVVEDIYDKIQQISNMAEIGVYWEETPDDD